MEFGGAAISPTINSSWDQAIYGVASGTVVNSGSAEYVYSGGTAIGTVVNNDNHGGLDVFSGGTAISTTVNSESVLTVYGFASSSIVNSGGSEFVSGGTAIGTVVDVGGLETVQYGGTASSTVLSGGSEIVSASGTDDGAQLSGGEQDVFGYASGATVLAGSQVIEAGGTASSTTVSNGGKETVSAGGTDLGAQISFGGQQKVLGYASGATISTMGYRKFSLAVRRTPQRLRTLAPSLWGGYTAAAQRSTPLFFEGVQYVGYITGSGRSINTSISHLRGTDCRRRGRRRDCERHQDRQWGLAVCRILLWHRLGDRHYDFGRREAVRWILLQRYRHGHQYDYLARRRAVPWSISGGVGTATSTTISSGGFQYVAYNSGAGTAIDTMLDSGGEEIVSSGGSDLCALISGGTQFDYGYASGAIVFSGAQLIQSGGSASSTTISGGTEIVRAGGSDIGAHITNGEQDVFGSVVSATIFGGSQVIESGTTESGVVISGGTEIVTSGGTDLDAQMMGGIELDYGQASGAMVLAGAQLVESGATAISTMVSGGSEIVAAHGFDLTAQIAGGTQFDFGLTNGAKVFAGLQLVECFGRYSKRHNRSSGAALAKDLRGGTAIAPHVLAGAAFVVGGTLFGFTVSSGVTLEVSAGTASKTTVLSGGTLELLDGATQSGTTISSGGTLEIGSGQTLSGYRVSRGITANGITVSRGGAATIASGAVVSRSRQNLGDRQGRDARGRR